MYWIKSPRRGAGWTSESTHRTAIRSAAGLRSVTVMLIAILPSSHADRHGDAVQIGGISPAELVALRSAVRTWHGEVVELPVRITGSVHHHVVLTGETEP